MRRTEADIQVPKLGIFLWGYLKEFAKLVGIDGFAAFQIEWFIFGGSSFL